MRVRQLAMSALAAQQPSFRVAILGDAHGQWVGDAELAALERAARPDLFLAVGDFANEDAEVVARVLGAERAASLERGFAPHELVRDFVKARDALAVRELCALVFPGGSSRNLCLATLRGDGGGEAEPGGPTWLAALDAADDVFLRELVVHGPPPHCTPSEEAEAAFYEGLGEATRPLVGLRAAHGSEQGNDP